MMNEKSFNLSGIEISHCLTLKTSPSVKIKFDLPNAILVKDDLNPINDQELMQMGYDYFKSLLHLYKQDAEDLGFIVE